MRIDRLGDLGSPHQVLRAVGDATNRLDLPPPAALTGQWFGALAVIAPSLSVQPVNAAEAFDVRPGSHSTTVGGGWIGYLSYPDPGSRGQPARVPEAAGGWTDCVLRCDRERQWWYESLSGAPMPSWLVKRSALRRPRGRSGSTGTQPIVRRIAPGCWPAWRPSAAGEVYQACVCTQFSGSIAGDPLDFFLDGVARTAPARAAYVAGPWGAVASLSPELFLCRRGDLVTSSPIKGTLPLDAPPSALRASSKDVAENVMIVDLVRNDLGRVAVTGSVTVPELLVVRPAPGVWHLVSTVSAQVPHRAADLSTAGGHLPAGIDHRNAEDTRPRTDFAVGALQRAESTAAQSVWRRQSAGCELNVAIRTVEFDAVGNAVLGVRRRHHRRLRSRRRVAGMPAQGGADHRGGRRLSRALAAPRRRAHAVTTRPE